MAGNSLVDLGELSKPAIVLIEKISEAIGAVFRPLQIRRLARAEADAEWIRRINDLAISDLIEERAFARFIAQEVEQQANIETIVSGALPLLDDGAEAAAIERDWISNFLDKSRLISDAEMQGLWSRILAGEANRHGAFSKRTVDIVGSMDAGDASLFTFLCRFVVDTGEPHPFILSLDPSYPIYHELGVTVAKLTHLDDIGLIRYSPGAYSVALRAEEHYRWAYFDAELCFRIAQPVTLYLGVARFTRAGYELFRIVDAEKIPDFVQHLWDGPLSPNGAIPCD